MISAPCRDADDTRCLRRSGPDCLDLCLSRVKGRHEGLFIYVICDAACFIFALISSCFRARVIIGPGSPSMAFVTHRRARRDSWHGIVPGPSDPPSTLESCRSADLLSREVCIWVLSYYHLLLSMIRVVPSHHERTLSPPICKVSGGPFMPDGLAHV